MNGAARARRVVALVAARNEEPNIAAVVAALRAVATVGSVVVAVGDSTDGTAAAARAAGARVLVAAQRDGRRGGGKGAALQAAVDATPDAEVYVLVDGDVGATAGEAETLLHRVLGGACDLAVGRLGAIGGGGFGIVKKLTAWAIRVATGLAPREPLSGRRAVRAELLRRCGPLAAGFGTEAAMTVDAVRLGARVEEVDVRMTHRPTGRSLAGFVHRGRQGSDIARALAPRLLGIR